MLPPKPSHLSLILFDIFIIFCKVWVEAALEDFANFINLNKLKKKDLKNGCFEFRL